MKGRNKTHFFDNEIGHLGRKQRRSDDLVIIQYRKVSLYITTFQQPGSTLLKKPSDREN